MRDPTTSLDRAARSLCGLSVGDAFGEQFFVPDDQLDLVVKGRVLPPAPWHYTDDTEMALSIVATLRTHGEIRLDELMRRFAQHFDPSRGYGPSMQRTLRIIGEGAPWRDVIADAFEGQGSYGNGSAMRAGPVGAYFADDLALAVAQAELSSRTTHTHPEAVAGAVAVAVAAAVTCRDSGMVSPAAWLNSVLAWIPPSEVRSRLERASTLPEHMQTVTAAAILGNGSQLSAQDTVPFALWCAAKHMGNFEDALWAGVSAGGDRDTISAIVGSVVVMAADVPASWLGSREALPQWFLQG